MIETGKQYCDANNSRRLVISIEGDTVEYLLPVSQKRERCPVSEFEEWSVGEYVNPFV